MKTPSLLFRITMKVFSENSCPICGITTLLLNYVFFSILDNDTTVVGIDRHTHDIVGWCVGLVVAFDGLDGQRSVAGNLQWIYLRSFFLALGIQGDSHDVVCALLCRYKYALVWILCICTYQQAVGIKPHLTNGTCSRCCFG